jgi:predicted dithiol-disulfide oxidoreductase (DUF899 family)
MVAAETIDTAESPAEAALDNVFAALADPVRRAVLTRLDGEDLLVSELAAPFDISLQAVSRHIQVLVRAGLVKQERTGRISRCRLDAGPIFEAALWLNRYSKYWQSQFDTLAVWLDHISSAEQEGPDARSRGQRKMAAYRREIAVLRDKMRVLQKKAEPEDVEDYRFATTDGPVRLSQLFGDKKYLFVIHNMGKGCPNCTMWADGFNGVLPHLENRAAFVVSSPDDPETQRAFARERGWRFRMVSHQGTSFAADMGYRTEQGWMPGVSVFRRIGNRIYRVSDAPFDEGDDFCTVWHLFDLLPEGAAGWRPQFSYP